MLKQANLIACEDTRHTQKLLNHFGISRTRTVSYHEHNEAERAEDLVREVEQGARVALVSDAGMPGISDPGYRVIALAIQHHTPVVPIPGAAAFAAALAASGLSTGEFRFRGFFPAKRGPRRKMLEDIRTSQATEIFYEAPHRVTEAVEDLVEVLGTQRHVVLARELTKVHEEFLRGTAGELLNLLQARGEIKGEITLLVGKAEDGAQVEMGAAAPPKICERVQQLMANEQLDREGRAEEGGEGARDFEERGLPGVAEGEGMMETRQPGTTGCADLHH